MVGQQLIATVPVGLDPYSIAVNPTTQKVYVANETSGTVTVIDENTLSTVTVPVVQSGAYIAINQVTNKIYVSGFWGFTVIDGATNNTTTITSIYALGQLAVNPVTNKIYAVGSSDVVYVIDGDTLSYTSVPVGSYPIGIAVNSVTNKIYVSNNYSSSVTVIDGATNNTTSVSVAFGPSSIAVNSTTNKIYVAGQQSLSVAITVIDGATLATTTVLLGQSPGNYPYLGVNQTSNKIYVGLDVTQYTNYVVVIDGATLSTTTIALGLDAPFGLAVEPVTNKIYLPFNAYGVSSGLVMVDGATNYTTTVLTGELPGQINVPLAVDSGTNRIYVVANSLQQTVWVVNGFSPQQFNAVKPCRLVDTRQNGGQPIQGGTSQSFILPQLGGCNIPTSAVSYSLNVTVVPHGPLGYLTVWPTGELQPTISTLNSSDGRIKANAAIVEGGLSDAVSVYASDTTDVILDIDGYFSAPGSQSYQFYPLTPCRLVDTRSGNGGPLQKGLERDYVIAGSCGIPATATAYSFNVTVLPTNGELDYLTVWPQGETQPVVSTLNDPTGTVVANAAIVPAGNFNATAFYAHDNPTNLLLDVNGYFAPAGTGGLSLYTAAPCRALDTRNVGNGQPFTGDWNPPNGLNLLTGPCPQPASAQAFAFNATVVPSGVMPFLTLWPHGESQPNVSTLNGYDGFITSNMAIVPTTDGSIDAYAAGLTQLILDISGYFAP